MYRRNGSHSLSPGLLGPPRPLPLLQSHGCPAPTCFSLRARGQEGMPQEQADVGSIREHRPLGLQGLCPLPAQRARPCLLLFLLLFQDKQMGFCWDPWQVSALAPPTVWPAPADTVALALWAQLGPTALPALGSLMDTGLGRVLWGLAGPPRTWGAWVVGWEGWGAIWPVYPLAHPSPSYRPASRPPTATWPTPGPAPAATAWQPWPPRPSWVSSGCPLLPWGSSPCPLATGGGKVRAELPLEGLQPCWTQEFSKRRAPGSVRDSAGRGG